MELQSHGDLEQLFHRFDEPPLHLSELNINVRDTLPSTSSSNWVIDVVEHSDKHQLDLEESLRLFALLWSIQCGELF